MKSWFCWILILFRNVSADPAPRYAVHHTPVSFDQAAEHCSPTGILTTLATEQEVTNVLEAVAMAATAPHRGEFTFWIGLRKLKDGCVVPTLPLRGFKWMKDGSEKSQVSRWAEEPRHTCTTARCAALKGELDGLNVTRWGLIAVSCKTPNNFICKLKNAEQKPNQLKPDPEQEPTPSSSPEPDTQPTKAEPGPDPGSQRELAATESSKTAKDATQQPDMKPKTTPELQGSGFDPVVGSDSCQPPHIPSARSISLDRANSSRILVECWSSSAQLELRCSGWPAVWRLKDDSPANFTDICSSCEAGFQKDASGNCVDVDECSVGGSGGPCRHSCLNTVGSYRCFCSDQSGNQHSEDSPECAEDATSGVLMVALVAVVALVVLLVVVMVTVKCCLMRQSKKRAMKKAEKMAMESKDSFENK
ncbi:C-type lectin domain family 14 member A [Sander vitreus]